VMSEADVSHSGLSKAFYVWITDCASGNFSSIEVTPC
jgi:hypothetical protein